MKGLVWGKAEAGSLEMTELKSVTVGIRRRGRWDVVRFGGDKWELEIHVVKDLVMDGSEMLEFKLDVPGAEPCKERDFVIMEGRSLEDVSGPLMFLCVCRRVVDMTGNGGLSVG